MFRILLLVFIFLYFNGNFFYGFTFSYIPFKNAQNINIYNIYKVFDDTSFNTLMNNSSLTGSTFLVDGIGKVDLEKTSGTGIILKLPFRVNHRYGEQLEILVPIINDTGNISSNDTLFDSLQLSYKNNFIEGGMSYLKFWIDYNTITTPEELKNTTVKNYKMISLNKLYIIKKSSSPNNIFLLR